MTRKYDWRVFVHDRELSDFLSLHPEVVLVSVRSRGHDTPAGAYTAPVKDTAVVAWFYEEGYEQ